MPYQGKIYGDSLPFQFRVPSATETQDGVMTKEQVQLLDSIAGGSITEIIAGNRIQVLPIGTTREISALITRPVATIFVGAAINPSIIPDGSAYAPYPEIADALAWVATQPPGQFNLICSPQDYAECVIPAGYSIVLNAAVASPGCARISKLTLTGTSGGGFPTILRGFIVDETDTATDGGVDPQAIFVLLESGNSGPVTNPASIGLSVISAGVLEAANLIISVVMMGSIDVGANGFCVFHNVDIQQPVTADLMTVVDCRIPSALTANGAGPIRIYECEDDAFPGPCVVTFGAPGVLGLDTLSVGKFVASGSSIVNGTVQIDDVGPYATAESASALAQGAPVFSSGGQVALIDGSQSALRRFAGFAQLAAVAPGAPQIVAGPGVRPVGLGALTPDRAYYVSGAVVSGSPMYFFSEDDLAVFLAGAPSGSWYRQVGVSLANSQFIHSWGEPQQVP